MESSQGVLEGTPWLIPTELPSWTILLLHNFLAQIEYPTERN